MILATKLKNRFSSSHTVALKNIRLDGENLGCSGFIEFNGVWVYVNTGHFGSMGCMYRIAKHSKDYTGGVNQWAKDLDSLVHGIDKLLKP